MNPVSALEGVCMLRLIEQFARVSHRSEEAQTYDSWKRFIKAVVVDKGDWSVTEHCSATVIFRVDRGVTHEIVRHRLFSYTQESTRFVNYGKKEIEFVEPAFANKQRSFVRWQQSVRDSELEYLDQLELGESPQIARSVLPNATAATLVMTGNLRNWRQLLMMRATKETHPDLRRITIPLLAAFKERVPLLYDDLEPEQKQSISLSRPR